MNAPYHINVPIFTSPMLLSRTNVSYSKCHAYIKCDCGGETASSTPEAFMSHTASSTPEAFPVPKFEAVLYDSIHCSLNSNGSSPCLALNNSAFGAGSCTAIEVM